MLAFSSVANENAATTCRGARKIEKKKNKTKNKKTENESNVAPTRADKCFIIALEHSRIIGSISHFQGSIDRLASRCRLL